MGINGLEDQNPAGGERSAAQGQEPLEVVEVQLLDETRGEDGSEEGLWEGEQVRERVVLYDLMTLLAAAGGQDWVGFDTGSRHACLYEQVEKLPPARAQVEDGLPVADRSQIGPAEVAHAVLGAAEDLLERW